MHTLLKMSLPMVAAMAMMPEEAGAQSKKFSLDNTVFGGRETRNYYPFDASAWPCTESKDILYMTSDRKLKSSSTEDVTPYSVLSNMSGGGMIMSARTSEEIWMGNGDELFLLNLADNSKVRLEGPYDECEIAPHQRMAAMTDGNDLYVVTPEGRKRVNTEREDGLRFGSTVHRSEFGITGGMFWSPNGERLCFYRKDETMVTVYPLVDVTARCASVVATRYPMAGETSEQVSVGIYTVKSGETIYLKTASPVNRYFTNISWSPDGKQIAMAEINREQNHMWLNIYDSETGELVKTLFEETNEHWIEPETPAHWTDNSHFGWLSYRDGFRHLYYYDTTNGKCKQLTTGEWCVTDLYGFDQKSKSFIIQTNREGYLYRDICKVGLNAKIKSLTEPKAFSNATYADNAEHIICNTSSAGIAKTTSVINVAKEKSTTVATNHNPYAGFAMPEIRMVDLKTADGKHDLSGRMILPSDFSDKKKYPVIVYVYGGPHSQMVDGSWMYGTDPWMLYFAQEGYIIFTMDNRGTERRGSEFEQAIHRQLGKCEAADQMQGVKYLKSLPFVDSEHIGVYGWSFGGFMTMTLLTQYPDEFCAGVAGGPVCDWKYYEVMYGERYMDTPQENPEGYEQNSIINNIDKLKARLMVVHDGMDSTVVWQHSQQLLNSAIKKGVFIDYAVYPNHPHNVRGADRTHLIGRIKRYFDDWMKRD